MRSWSSHSGLCSFFPLVAISQFFFWYNIMIKVNQHALINLVYSYMVTKVFNFQPVLVHQYYLCRLLWFKKQSFTLVWKPNPPLLSPLRAPSRSCWCSECWLYEALLLKVHLFMWSVKSDSCYNVLWLCSAQKQTCWSSRPCICTSATTYIFFTGGVVRLTAKPRYLLLLHRGNKKSNTVTALIHSYECNLYCTYLYLIQNEQESVRNITTQRLKNW